MERDLQRPRLRRSTTDRRRRVWTPYAGRSSCFFFFFRFSASSSNNSRFAFLALKVASQGFTWKILICSSKINHVLRCSLSGELARSLRGELTCGPLFEVLHRSCSCSWLNRKSSALPSAGFVRRLESLSWKVRLGLQSYSIWSSSWGIFSCVEKARLKPQIRNTGPELCLR